MQAPDRDTGFLDRREQVPLERAFRHCCGALSGEQYDGDDVGERGEVAGVVRQELPHPADPHRRDNIHVMDPAPDALLHQIEERCRDCRAFLK